MKEINFVEKEKTLGSLETIQEWEEFLDSFDFDKTASAEERYYVGILKQKLKLPLFFDKIKFKGEIRFLLRSSVVTNETAKNYILNLVFTHQLEENIFIRNEEIDICYVVKNPPPGEKPRLKLQIVK